MRPRGLRSVNETSASPLRQAGGQSKVRVRTLRDVQATEVIGGRATPTTHAQRFAEIAWLERETERLQREASVLDATHQRIQQRLAEIAERRLSLLDLVRESLPSNGQTPAAGNRAPAKAKDDEQGHTFTDFALEY